MATLASLKVSEPKHYNASLAQKINRMDIYNEKMEG